jgi:dolichol-phosphate mannosyltransferase
MAAIPAAKADGALTRLWRWFGTREGQCFLALFILALLVRLALAPIPLFPHDPQVYANWGVGVRHHFFDVYTATTAEYPPLSIYLFGLVVQAYALVAHLLGTTPSYVIPQSHLLTAFIKLVPIVSDMGMIAVLYAIARGLIAVRWALLVVATYAFSPYILCIGALWGQQDADYTLVTVIALLLMLKRRDILAGVLCGAAIMLKPMPIFLVPLFFIYLWRWESFRSALRYGVGFVATALIICLPYVWPPHPQVMAFLHAVSLAEHPIASYGALNLWWVFNQVQQPHPGFWSSWLDTTAPMAGPLTPNQLGYAMLGISILVALAGVWRHGSARVLFAGATLISFSFYMLTTAQAVRYFFPVVALLLITALYDRRFRLVYIATSLVVMVNQAIYIVANSPGTNLEADLSRYNRFLYNHLSWLYVLAFIMIALYFTSVVLYIAGMRTSAAAEQAKATATLAPQSPPVSAYAIAGAPPFPSGYDSEYGRDAEFPAHAQATLASADERGGALHQRLDKMVSVVLPCYNEEGNIRPMYQRLTATLAPLVERYEIIFVNNGSYDGSAPIFAALAAEDTHVSVLTLSRNFGAQGAYTSGLAYASGDGVVCMDGDLQDPPELIQQFVAKWREGYEVVYGERVRRKGSLIRRVGYRLFYRMMKRLSYVDIPLDAGEFGLMDRKVVDVINAMPERSRLIRGLRAWAGFRQVGVPYVRDERHTGRTNYSMLDLFHWASVGLVSFSYAPLTLISYLAAAMVGLAAVGIVVYMALFFIFPDAPRGFQTLLMIVLFLGGTQLLCLSIIGAYLGKMFEELKGRPKYIIQSVRNDHRAAVSRLPEHAPAPAAAPILRQHPTNQAGDYGYHLDNA